MSELGGSERGYVGGSVGVDGLRVFAGVALSVIVASLILLLVKHCRT